MARAWLDLPRQLDLIDFELGRMVSAIEALINTEARFTQLAYCGLIAEVRWYFHQIRKLSKEQKKGGRIDFIEDDTLERNLCKMLGLIDRLGEIKSDEKD